MNHFIFNGRLLREGTAIAGPDNRGLRYGDGIFETMKMVDGRLQLASDHFARLWKGLGMLGFDIPKQFTPEKLTEEIGLLAVKNGHQHAARVRLQVMRGDGGLFDANNNQPQYSIQTWALPERSGSFNSNGLVLGIYEKARKSCDAFAALKHNNYLPYLLAALHAKKEKWNDALVLNSDGRVCDSCIANVFIVKNNRLLTPPLAEGCVAGVMRQQILQQLKNTELAVTESPLVIGDLLAAEEIFLTNSLHPVRWVYSLGDASFGNSLTKKVYETILPTFE